MYFYKINNLKQPTGNLDYKGLDLSQIVAGTQVYPHDFVDDNVCLLASLEKYDHEDVHVLTESEYVDEKERIESAFPVIEDEETKIDRLEKENVELKMAMVEMAGTFSQSITDVQMAMAELAGAMSGGDE